MGVKISWCISGELLANRRNSLSQTLGEGVRNSSWNPHCAGKCFTKPLPRGFQNYSQTPSRKVLGSVFGRTDYSRIFIFGPPDCFADFVAGLFLLIFVGKSAQKNPPRKSPAKSSKICTTKSPTHFCRGAGPN